MEALKKNNKYHDKIGIIQLFFLFCIIYLFNYSLCVDCPRDKPILKDGVCQSIFCPPLDYANNKCIISNPFIESQWLDYIHTFASDGISHVWATSDSKGGLFLIGSGFNLENAADKYIYAYQNDGNGFFYNKDKYGNNYYSFKKIDFPDDKFPEIFYRVDFEQEKYLLSTQTENEMFLVDFKNQNFTVFTLDTNTFFSDILFKLKGYSNNDEEDIIYFDEYVNCKDHLTYNECFLGLRIFKLSLTGITILVEKNEEIQIEPLSKINCFQNEDLYIQCIYTTIEKNEKGQEQYNRVIALFNNKNLNVEYKTVLQENYKKDNSFESTIQLNGNVFVTGFSDPNDRNIIKLFLKTFIISSNSDSKGIELEDYIPKISTININEDKQYIIDRGAAKRNTMIKLSETKFAMLLNEFTDANIYSSFNKNLLILIFNIFDYSKISIRHYRINFELYNLTILEDLRGYTLNNFFGVLLETGIDTSSHLTKAIFVTFGYVNLTMNEIPIDKNLKENNDHSLIKPGDFVSEITNNLFAYKFKGIQIINVPHPQICGYFINNESEEKIKVGDIISEDTILRFILVREIILGNDCSIEFAGVVEEPDFDYMNENAERVDVYPVNNTEIEREFYSPKSIIGRVIKYRIDVGCYDSCESCDKLTNNKNDQHCLQCIDNYYFVEGTQNCFDSIDGYYLNKETGTFFPIEDREEEEEEEEKIIPEGECPRDKPIKKNDKCLNVYCSAKEFEDETCVIANSIIKNQWMNNIIRFGEGSIIFIALDYGYDGDLFLLAQKRENDINENYIYGFNKNGNPLFYDNDTDEYSSFKIMPFPNDKFIENIKYVRNIENQDEFLITNQVDDEIYEINFNENKTFIHKINNIDMEFSSDKILALKNNYGEYISYFAYCQENLSEIDKCFPYFRRFKIESNNNIIKIKESKDDININSKTNFICVENSENYIQCVYSEISESNIKHSLGFFSIDTFEKVYTFDLESEFEEEVFFDSMISLNKDAFVIAYSKKHILKVLLKTITFDNQNISPNIMNYIEGVDYININEDGYYNLQSVGDKDSLCKINDNKFAILLDNMNDMEPDTFGNPSILIYIYTIFNEHKNVNIRRYSINFKLHNMLNYGSILGYNIGDFFGILIELSSPYYNDVASAAFMTFGYVNCTSSSTIYNKDFFEGDSLISMPIVLGNYIGNIENNLFGYVPLGGIILLLPDYYLGYFTNNNGEKILINQIINLDTEIKLELNENYVAGMYSIIFAGAVMEPDYNKMNKYSEELISYPKDSNVDEKDFYEPEIFIGKKIEFKFEVKSKKEQEEDKECYPSCQTCFPYKKNDENHQCETCKPGYYFKEDTNNCYQSIDEYYYFDEEKQIFSHCHENCLTCSNKAIKSTYMNCLSCDPDKYFYYEKSTNCLYCPKYVNYMQTECIDEIPEGYYLSDKNLHTIEKCHYLCKTCKSGPYILNDLEYMNCETCLFTNPNFKPTLEGDCPSNEETKYDDEPIDGQCSREKPILKDNKCQNIYCTKEEFDNGICQIYNDYIKIQWLNNFHIFNDLSDYVSYDINDNGDLFLLAQQKDNLDTIQYLYGFNTNGNGLFYEKEKNKFSSFKTIKYQFKTSVEKIKYINIDNQEYLLNVLKDKQIYLVDYNNNDIYTQSFLYSPFSLDTIIKLKNKENEYLIDFVFCADELVYDNCSIGFAKYKIDKKDNLELVKASAAELVKVKYYTKISCFENSFNIIQCKYSLNSNELGENKLHILSLFNSDTFELIQNFVLDEFFEEFQNFDSMIELKDNVCIIAYSTRGDRLHVLIKKIDLDENKNYILLDYLENISNIVINEDSAYDLSTSSPFRNSLFKLNENEFVMLINDCKNSVQYSDLNSGMVIITFQIYNSNKNIILRHYKINFSLYNIFIDEDILGYKLGDFFGALIELTSPKDKYQNRAAFLTFGYVNTTEDISYEEGTNSLINNKENIIINKYILGIENNVFGYEILGVKILSLPDENQVGYFKNLKNNEKISLDEIIDIDSELEFEINAQPVFGKYSLSFAGVVKEPDYDKANKIATKFVIYPDASSDEKYLNYPKIFVGKEFKYNFSIEEQKEEPRCFQFCKTCLEPSSDINNQKCLTCKDSFYFIDGTQNCFDRVESKYYFNYVTRSFSPCYKDCYKCDTKENNSTHMNCLSCALPFRYYKKSTNCLNCPKYVNYLQTECINEIPEGYYLLDKDYRTIEKCYSLCKTCKSGSYMEGSEFHMNCETCLYKNNSKITIEGNCPLSIDINDDINKKKNNKNNPNNHSLAIWISILSVIFVLIIIGLIVYIKCFKNKGFTKKNNSDYFNIGGKNIPLDEDSDSGIN